MGCALPHGEGAVAGGEVPLTDTSAGPEAVAGLVSTIIPVYNRPGMLLEAVGSVLQQTYRPIEIIVVDDGSTDDTCRVADDLEKESPGIVRVIHRENGGPGLAREAGRVVARGEFIQYLDSDDFLLPNKFAIQVALLRTNPDCGIAYGVTRLVDEHGALLKAESKWTGRKFDYLFPGLLIDRWWHTSTPLYRRVVSDAAGPWLPCRPEDWDLEARMGANRVRLVYDSSPVSCHRHHASANRVTMGSHAAYVRDEAWFLPRLRECAIRAGVSQNSDEMRHLSDWSFMRARELGGMGESELAYQLLSLARTCVPKVRWEIRIIGISARAIGWRATALLCRLLVRR